MAEFLGNLSIAEAMGDLYGNTVKLITSLIGVMSCIGAVAVQFKVSATILQLLFNVSSFYAVLVAAIIVVLYSSLGGIKAVTFTDVVQIFTFAVIIPIISLVIWGTLDGPEEVFYSLSKNPSFDYKQVFNIYNPQFLSSILLFLFFIIPTLEPAIFQRIAMAKNTMQVKKSFALATLICLSISLVIAWIAVLLLAENPNLDPNSLLAHIINKYSYPGLKGLIAIGIMAIIMSTADSYINSASVLLTNDICRPLNLSWAVNKELLLSRIFSIFVGILAFFLAFNTKSLLELTFLIWGSYMPIITVPLILAILDFRSTSKAALIGMSFGVITILTFKLFDFKLNNVIPAMIVNAVFFIGSHYLLKQSGGWVGIKNPEPLIALRFARKRKLQKLSNSIKKFNLWAFCKSNLPKQEYTYSLFALFCIISVFSTMYSIPKEIQLQHQQVLEFVYHTVLISSSILLTFPIWPLTFKQERFIIIAWNILVPYMLIFAPTLLIIVSNFGQFQLMIFLLNMVIIALMLRWQVAIFMTCSTVFLSVESYKWYVGVEDLNSAIDLGLQFKIMYALLFTSTILIAFLKPKQEYMEATEEKVGTLETEVTHLGHEVTDLSGEVLNLNEKVTHYSERVFDQEKEIERLGATAQKILNNVNHELRLPIGNVMNFSDMLHKALQKSGKHIQELSEEVYKNSTRASSMILNMLDLATLDVKKVDLQKTTINFSELVADRVKTCRKIYLQNKKINFELTIDPEVMIAVDPNYIRQTVDNLVINAISFSQTGLIKVIVKKQDGQVIFTIIDQGKGIPPLELSDIFTPFKMGSNTESKAEGRGVGLALCKSAVEAHGGEIKAQSDGKSGATFRFVLPI